MVRGESSGNVGEQGGTAAAPARSTFACLSDDAHQVAAARRRRLRWRARRGLLENDLILTRFLDRNESSLSEQQIAGLHYLLDLPDNELMDLILARTQLGDDASQAVEVLTMLRVA